jgi:NADP-dependent 3-hydroxy acid dehydrogenase YdfG
VKIVITGGTAGIGLALGNQFRINGHEVTGISRRTGHNIRSVPKIANTIEPYDMWISSAQAGFTQTELLFEMSRRWTGTHKSIVVIGTMMTSLPVSFDQALDEYRVQKIALDEAVGQIRHRCLGLRLMVVRPGDIATHPEKTVPPSADVDVWARTLVDIMTMAQQRNLSIPDISLGPAK